MSDYKYSSLKLKKLILNTTFIYMIEAIYTVILFYCKQHDIKQHMEKLLWKS